MPELSQGQLSNRNTVLDIVGHLQDALLDGRGGDVPGILQLSVQIYL